MKERKVWIDGEFPQVYFDPKTGNESIEGRPFILENIKTHDREVVKEVCEKIRKWGNKHFNYVGDGTGYDGQDYNEMIGFNNAIIQLNEFLAQIQKEYEK